MKLRHSPTSPFVRKVLVTAIETGLRDRIELLPADVWAPGSDIVADNPLGKVPALLLDGGETLYDSPVICEYLDSLHDGAKLFPPAGGARWTALRRQALADGLADASVLRRLEVTRAEGQRSDAWANRQVAVMGRALDALEDEADRMGQQPTIGHIAIACALGYLDLRFDEDNWRWSRPALADWFDLFSQRRSMTETVHKT